MTAITKQACRMAAARIRTGEEPMMTQRKRLRDRLAAGTALTFSIAMLIAATPGFQPADAVANPFGADACAVTNDK